MLEALTLLLLCQLVGEAISRAAALPVPGPVIGLVLLAALLLWRGVPAALHDTAHGILKALGLLFVPAGVGVMQHLGLLADQWLALGAALLVSTLATLLVTVGVFRLASRSLGLDEPADGGEA